MKKKYLIGGNAAFTLLILMIGVALCSLVVKKRTVRIGGHENYSKDVTSINKDLERRAFPKRFSYKELVAATNGFANTGRLGQGGSGHVYKGILQDLGCEIALKKIFAKSDYYEKIFINEVKIISRLLDGVRRKANAYLFMHTCLTAASTPCNGSSGISNQLTYCWTKTSALSSVISGLQTIGVVGTFGYIAPEYANGGRASKECDMFSFGVVALEIACGRRTYQDGEFHVPLVSWVWELYLAGNLLHAADERLDKIFDKNEMECLLIVGLWCTHPSSKGRPRAGKVMKVLQLEAPLPELPHDMQELEHHLSHHDLI
ncbi:unnamed protein product [Prunus armeniaca]